MVGCHNGIKNPENDPKRVVGCHNGIKNPKNDPKRVVKAQTGSKIPKTIQGDWWVPPECSGGPAANGLPGEQ